MEEGGCSSGFFRSLVESSTAALVVVGEDGKVRYQTPGASRIVRGAGASVVGESFAGLFTSQARPSVEAYLCALAAGEPGRSSFVEASCVLADGDERWLEMTGVSLLSDPSVGGIVLNLADRTEHHRVLEQVMIDPLTGLANFRAVSRTLVEPGLVIVMLIDPDTFKGVNDTYGHTGGDEVLVSIARRLENAFGVSCVVSRCGGDEFVVILPESELPRARRASNGPADIPASRGRSSQRVSTRSLPNP